MFRILTLRFLLNLTLAVCVGDSHCGAEQTQWRPRAHVGAPVLVLLIHPGARPSVPPLLLALFLRSAFHLAPVFAAPVALWLLLSCVAEVPPAHSRCASSLA